MQIPRSPLQGFPATTDVPTCAVNADEYLVNDLVIAKDPSHKNARYKQRDTNHIGAQDDCHII